VLILSQLVISLASIRFSAFGDQRTTFYRTSLKVDDLCTRLGEDGVFFFCVVEQVFGCGEERNLFVVLDGLPAILLCF
jgi:hypothetical protein